MTRWISQAIGFKLFCPGEKTKAQRDRVYHVGTQLFPRLESQVSWPPPWAVAPDCFSYSELTSLPWLFYILQEKLFKKHTFSLWNPFFKSNNCQVQRNSYSPLNTPAFWPCSHFELKICSILRWAASSHYAFYFLLGRIIWSFKIFSNLNKHANSPIFLICAWLPAP